MSDSLAISDLGKIDPTYQVAGLTNNIPSGYGEVSAFSGPGSSGYSFRTVGGVPGAGGTLSAGNNFIDIRTDLARLQRKKRR